MDVQALLCSSRAEKGYSFPVYFWQWGLEHLPCGGCNEAALLSDPPHEAWQQVSETVRVLLVGDWWSFPASGIVSNFQLWHRSWHASGCWPNGVAVCSLIQTDFQANMLPAGSLRHRQHTEESCASLWRGRVIPQNSRTGAQSVGAPGLKGIHHPLCTHGSARH